jgi:sigma-B regulation protein RsbU (phosphoserine phosphatase)
VSSLYLPSRTLGGDCYDYRWIDDDHLVIKLLDVSGHGIEAALLAVSIHNLLRSGTLSPDILRSPHEVLTELNRLFPMDDHGGHYFTLWYGVYQPSTRTLSYASAGHPPALAFTATGTEPVELFTPSEPIGMFDDSEFHTATYHVPANAHILIYSDGAFELALPDGNHWSLTEFIDLFTELSESPDWSLDTIVDHLHNLQPDGLRDDCSLIKLDFP